MYVRQALIAGVLLAVTAGTASAAEILIVNNNKPNIGFNDPTPTIPVGGNPGTTLGRQRLIAAQYAADLWGAYLFSPVRIEVGAVMTDLACSTSGAVLGSAIPNCLHTDFVGAPEPGHFYPSALANSLFGADLCPARAGCQCPSEDLRTNFNASIGTTCGISFGWYYGLDANPGENEFDFVTVFLHELGHGLGFASFTDIFSGQMFAGMPDTFTARLADRSRHATWPELDDEGRRLSAIDDGDLVWTGLNVNFAGAALLEAGRHASSGEVRMFAPSTLQPGSSVSHFDEILSPDELMEPSYTAPDHDLGMTVALMQDIGWELEEFCGNGVVDEFLGETCDDGNRSDGDCCDSDCNLDSFGTICTDDGNACTDNICDAHGVCQALPNTDPCDDEVFCNGADTCSGGSCATHTGNPCLGGEECLDVCDEASESCRAPFGVGCVGDANVCTTDICDGWGSCIGIANELACDDGNPCTEGDVCSEGSCVPGAAIPGCTTTTTTLAPVPLCGDASGDGQVLAADALMILQVALDLKVCDDGVCDVDADGQVTASDALRVLARTVDPRMHLTCAAF